MLLHIVIGIADVTRRRHILLIGFPGSPAGFNEVRQTWRIDETLVAVRGNAKGIATHQSNVIRQTGMSDCIILSQQSIVVSEFVKVGHDRITDDRTKFLILEQDHNNMIKIWN